MDWFLELPSTVRFLFILPAEFGIIAAVMFALKKFGVNIRTPWLQGIKNAFFMSLLICGVVGLITIVFKVGFGKSTSNGFAISFGILGSAICFWFFFNLFSVRQKAGQPLLDIAPIQNSWLFFAIGILAIGLGFSGYADFIGIGSQYSRLISIIVGLFSGTFLFIMGFSRIQIHEHGVLVYVDLIKWNRIESYEWINDNGKTYSLKFTYKGKLPEILRTGAIPVPLEKKVHVASLLEQFVPETTLKQHRA